MLCKYCGKKLPHVAIFCSECGKPQDIPEDHIPVDIDLKKISVNSKKLAGGKWIFPVAIFLMILAGAYNHFRSYDFMHHMNAGYFTWIYTAIGVVAVLVLWRMGKICPEKLKFRVLWIPVVFVVLSEYLYDLDGLEQSISMQIGLNYTVGNILGRCCGFLLEVTLGAECLWLWALFALLLCLQSATVKFKWYVHIIIPAVLFVWVFVLCIFINPCLTEYFGIPHESFSIGKQYSDRYVIGIFVRRSICYFFVYLAGTGWLGKLQTALFPVMIIIGGNVLQVILYMCGDLHKTVEIMMNLTANFYTLSHLLGALVFIKRRKGDKNAVLGLRQSNG